MLEISIPKGELWDEAHNEFIYTKETKIKLEHSLLSVSKWESKYKKPFIGTELTNQEMMYYIKCMTITQNVKDETYLSLTLQNLRDIQAYIEDPMTATTVNAHSKGGNREIVTSELIYYWMITLNIPMECQKWHLNRLLMLIQECNVKQNPPKKIAKNELIARNRALNARRKKKYHTKG